MGDILEIYGNKYNVYFSGSISEKDVNLIFKPREKKFSKEAKAFMDRIWKEKVENNPDMYDSDLIDLLSVENNGDVLNIYHDYTKFSYTLPSRMKEYRKFEEEGSYTSNHVAIPTLIRTTDNKIPIGSDLKIIKNMQKWKFPGGYWEKSASTIFENVKKECIEEIGKIELLNPQVIGIAKSDNATSITVLVDTPMSSKELYDFIKDNKENAIDSYEMAEVQFIDLNKNRINNLLNENLLRFGAMTAISLYNMLQFLKSSK